MAEKRVFTGKLNNKNIKSLDKQKATSIVIFRILIILLVDIIVCSLFNYVRSVASREYTFYFTVLPVLRYVVAALVLLSVAYLVYTIVKGIDTSAYIITPFMIFAICMYLAVLVAFYTRFTLTPILFWTMTVLASVLFALYYIYTILFYKK